MRDRTAVLVGVGVVAGLALLGWYAARKVQAGVAAGALDPTSANNLANRLASSITEAISGIKGDSPGAALHRSVYPEYENYDPTKPGTMEQQAQWRKTGIYSSGAKFVGDIPTVFDAPARGELPASDEWGAVTPFMVGA